MQTRATADNRCTVVLQAASPQMALAAGTVAKCLHIPLAEALARLTEAPARLAEDMPAGRARRLGTLLRLLGLQVAVINGDLAIPEMPHQFEVALQANGAAATAALGLLVAGAVEEQGKVAICMTSFAVIEGLDWAAVSALRRQIRKEPGVRLLVSDAAQASYDLIPVNRPTDPGNAAALARHLQRLGVARCGLTGAIGAELDANMRRLVMARFAQSGVIALNRDFQRFDLILTGSPDPRRRELADFLSARTSLPPSAFACPDTRAGLRIECGLTRADALAFQADYASIGIETCPRLSFTGEAQTA